MVFNARAGLVAGVLAVLLTACTPGSAPSGPPSSAPTPGVPTGAVPTSSVPPPTVGSTSGTMPNPKESTKAPVDLNKPAKTGKVVATVVKLRALKKAKARMPGEVAGPALAVTVKLVNNSKKSIDASAVLVTLYDSAKAPGGEMSAPPARPMRGTLKPGGSKTGVWVFTVPVSKRSPVTVNVVLPTESPVLAFRGPAPKK
jgi:hypothetical protein